MNKLYIYQIMYTIPALMFLSFILSLTLGLGVKFLTGTPKKKNVQHLLNIIRIQVIKYTIIVY